MSNEMKRPVIYPRVLPDDSDATERLHGYMLYLESDGKEGGALGGPLDFRGADLSGMQMGGLFLWYSNFSNVVLDEVNFRKAELTASTLDGASLCGAYLHRTQINECEARGAVFTGAFLVRAELHESVFTGADFRGSTLSGTRLHKADLTGADFRNASFGSKDKGSRTLLQNALLEGCRFEGADGWVVGPADVGSKENPQIIGGEELALWFTENGAPNLSVAE